ncbi:23S rRNA (adenine(2503)-C(2))-methyltransferase RlmN [Maridesulfovibrio hydrothermalis]|uniref:Probable dual-specificity RNA methyltransferase RlmN n=1 Tax=Maridesulfovibrio hydrothermalis AM13 = DSM 14728 TaxID=1121451 RepID=L0R848_9BACT|nr:23S rRNA (adenine(2503)-C(2))-methyltransferase RlmN [Maridesulfovibrio hydrothermalis]CCO22913.1 Ribosomal RNA large subunit methyltransferase N [Maridesulfovibrio hydrothermalis AM13 = DSM 14728]
MIDILNLDYGELENFVVKELKAPKFRTKQIWQWLWQKGVCDFDEMTNLAKKLRDELKNKAVLTHPQVDVVQTSKDGTIKLLLRLADGALVETVLIPMESRYTQCLSTQVGCAMGCTFCNTGLMGFERNMTMSEILGQVLAGRKYLQDNNLNPLKNLVFMGMGEPLLNLDNLIKSLKTLNNPEGLSFVPRRITVSSVGFIKPLEILGETGLTLPAISLHAPTQELREKIMPKAAKTHIDDLLAAMDKFPLKPRERVTYEYLLLGGVNDSIEHARQLVRILGHRKCKVNLIAYNPGDRPLYEAPAREKVLAFEKYLWDKKITATIRRSMGQDIKAACGQLKADRLDS